MSYIDLNSVGSTITSEGLVFPIDCSEPPETASEAEEMMGVHILDVDNEWIWSLSLVDGYNLLSFLDENLDIEAELMGGFNTWKEKVGNLMGQPDTLVEVV
tara:strand:+ start:207 stop:509 length:303 start_codon:yes stop_codon:yes gene_type:complete